MKKSKKQLIEETIQMVENLEFIEWLIVECEKNEKKVQEIKNPDDKKDHPDKG